MRRSLLHTVLVGLFAVTLAAAQTPTHKVSADYKTYSVTLEKPQTVLVFALWSTGDLALVTELDSEQHRLPAGVSTFGIRRDGVWIVGGPLGPFQVSNGPARLSCSPNQGLLEEVRRSRGGSEPTRWCTEVGSGMRTVVSAMRRPDRLLVLGTDPLDTPILIEKALAGLKLRGKADAVAADLAAALGHAIPGSSWWTAITR